MVSQHRRCTLLCYKSTLNFGITVSLHYPCQPVIACHSGCHRTYRPVHQRGATCAVLLAISNLINLYKRLVDIYRGHERSHDVVCAQYERDELLLGQLFTL